VDPKSRKVLEQAGGSDGGGEECRVTARLWYCSKELEPKGGFESGKHGFLPLSKGFKKWVLPCSSWLPVVAVQKTRVRVENDYKDSDEGILSLKKGELATASGEEANGWAQIRTDSGEEGWFPAGYIRFIRKYIELEEEEDKVIVAYNQLPQGRQQRGGSSARAEGQEAEGSGKGKSAQKGDGKTPQRPVASGGKSGRGGTGDGKKNGSKGGSRRELEAEALALSFSETEEERKEYSRRNRRTIDRFSPTWEESMEDDHGGASGAADTGKRARGGSVEVESEERSKLRDKLMKLASVSRAAGEDAHSKTLARETAREKKVKDISPVHAASSDERADGRRRRSGDQEPVEKPMVCGVCYNPNKKLGNARTIALLCNRCESLIRQGWPYWQHRDPKHHQPGHAVTITNLCIHCYQFAEQRDGCYEPQSHEDMASAGAPSSSTPRAGGSGDVKTGLAEPKVSLPDTRDAGTLTCVSDDEAGGAACGGLCVEGMRECDARTLMTNSSWQMLRTSDFEERKVEQLPEDVCHCHFCGQMYHDRCILYSKTIYGDIPPRCPNPACQEKWQNLNKPEANLKCLHRRARDIPMTPVAHSIQTYLEDTVFKGKSGAAGASDRVVVRTVSNVRRSQESTPGFTARYGKKIFPYRLKNIFAFIECDDGTDVAFLSLVVAEFGPDAPAPNTNKAYLSYVDSVHLYHQKKCLLRKGSALCTSTCSNPEACTAERKQVVRRIILGYLDSIRRRGFEALYIWVMPPNDLHHDYIFHMRPISQHCPKPCQLDAWYTKLLLVASEEGIIAGFDSNAQDEGDDEQDRTLPPSLFGPDMSLRHVPQFPGGLMLRALEAALEAGGSDALSKSGIPRSPDRRRVSNSSLSSAVSPSVVPAGEGRSRAGAVLNRETSRQNRERQQRAVHAMNSYMQQNSDLGSIFVVQYHKDKDADRDAKAKTPARKLARAHGHDSLEDDPLISVDEDKQSFTLNECAHLCALLNDLHLQFNDMRHGKFSTKVMVQLLMQNRKLDKQPGSGETGGVKGSLMAVAGTFINRFLTSRKVGEKEEDGKTVSREARALMQEAGGKKAKFAVERLVDAQAEAAVVKLRTRQMENSQRAHDAAVAVG